jgi:hypothetical protein
LGLPEVGYKINWSGQRYYHIVSWPVRRSQWPCGLSRSSAAERLLGSWVRIPPAAWVFVSCTVFVLTGRGLCEGPIPRPEESYRLWCVLECDQIKSQKPSTPIVNK